MIANKKYKGVFLLQKYYTPPDKRNADLPILWKDTSAEAGLQEKNPMVV